MLKVQITHLQAFPHICNDLLLQYPHSGDKIPYYERLCTENYQVCGMVQVGATRNLLFQLHDHVILDYF